MSDGLVRQRQGPNPRQEIGGTHQDDPPSGKALDDKLHNWMDEFFTRPVPSWEDAAVLGAIDPYWWRVAEGGNDGGLYPHSVALPFSVVLRLRFRNSASFPLPRN
jgi:hypothetical protein